MRALTLAALAASSCVTGYEEAFRVSPEEVDDLLAKAPFPERLSKRTSSEAPKLDGTIDLKTTVRLWAQANRTFLANAENLLLKEIDLEVARHNFWPVLQPLTYTGSYGAFSFGALPALPGTVASGTSYSNSQALGTGVTQALPYGGSITAGGLVTYANAGDPINATIVGTPTVGITLPLLKGRGAIVSMEPLVSASRAVVYARREFENFRQVSAVDIVGRYFAILQSAKQIANLQRNLDSARKLLAQSNAQYRFGRVTKSDVFRAEVQAIQGENDLAVARDNLKIQEGQFKVEIGLDPESDLTLREEPIAVRGDPPDEKHYIVAVLEDNLSWKNTREQFEDAKRALVIAAEPTRIQADLVALWSKNFNSLPPFSSLLPAAESWTVGLSVTVPLDRVPIDRNFQAAVIAFLQAERQLGLSRDVLVRQAKERLISVRQAALTVRLQNAAVEQAAKALRLLTLEYQQGKVPNRDVIDAQSKLILAENQLLQAQVSWKISMLNVFQFTGKMEVDEAGRWLE